MESAVNLDNGIPRESTEGNSLVLRQAASRETSWMELRSGDILWQEFKVESDYFSGFSTPIASFGKALYGSLKIRLFRKTLLRIGGDLQIQWVKIKTLRVELDLLFDEEHYEVHFETQIDSANQDYALEIGVEPSNDRNNCGVLLCGKDIANPIGEFRYNGSWVSEYSLSLRFQHSPPFGPLGGPPGLAISPVSSCDLNCTYCISRETRKRLAKMSPEMLREISSLAIRGVLTNAHTDFSGDIFFAEDRFGGYLDFMIGLDVPFSIHTHGNRMTDEFIDKLMSSRLESIGFSMDASEPETYRNIRRGSIPLTDVLENIDRFMAKREKLRRHSINVSLSIVLMKSNIEETIGLIDIASQLGISKIYGNHLHVYTEDMAGESLFNHKEYFNRMWHRITAKAETTGVSVDLPRRFENKQVRTGHRYCGLPWDSAILLANGDLMACCVPSTLMGNIVETPIEEIWNGSEYQELRRRVNSENPPEVCRSCPQYKIESNPDSYHFYKVRPQLKPLFQEMRESIAKSKESPSAG